MSGLAEFISANALTDVRALRLKYAGKEVAGLPSSFAIDQIECRRKTQRKLPWFNSHPEFIYPGVLAGEQATNQYVAAYHASLLSQNCGEVIDMTAGLGIDAFTLALVGHKVTAAELDARRVESLRHNKEILGLPVDVVEGDSIAWLSRKDDTFRVDCIFVDPARRDSSANRVFRLSECLPDVKSSSHLLLEHADRVMIKCSPLLDIDQAMKELPSISAIDIVCLHGECKEVLLTLGKTRPDYSHEYRESTECIGNPMIRVVDIRESEFPRFDKSSIVSKISMKSEELTTRPMIAGEEYFTEGNYVYEPNAGVRKLHCGGLLCNRFPGLRQFSPNTGLFVATERIPDFPGRAFLIESRPGGGELKKLKGSKAGVIARNHTMSASELRKKYGLKESEETYIIAGRITKAETPTIFACRKEP